MNSEPLPQFKLGAFKCPHCMAYAKQYWRVHSTTICRDGLSIQIAGLSGIFHTSTCEFCGKSSIWYNKQLVYPKVIMVAPPNQDMDDEIIADYNEAASILQQSPRGASAILRLATQKLCKQLGESGKNLNTDIANLVKRGLSPQIQKSLDSLRVIGNNAVHPGEISVNDTPEIALALFKLINKIADTMITDIKEIDAIYDSLPEAQRAAIEQRDNKR